MARSTVIRVRNGTGSNIPANRAVRVIGTDESDTDLGPLSLIALADNSSDATMPAVGITIDEIEPNATSIIRTAGLLGNVDTSKGSVNDEIFVGTNGRLVYEDPAIKTPGAVSQQVGTISKVDNDEGQILVSSLEIRRLHAVTHIEGGVDEISHSDLPDLEEDSHKQYLLVNGKRNVEGDLTIDENLFVRKNSNIKNNLTVQGDLTVKGDINIPSLQKYASVTLTSDTNSQSSLFNPFDNSFGGSFTTNSSSGITFDSNTGRFTPSITGAYRISGVVYISQSAIATLDAFRVRKNISGSPVTLWDASGNILIHSAVSPTETSFNFIIDLTVNDEIELEIDSSTSLTVQCHIGTTFNIERIA